MRYFLALKPYLASSELRVIGNEISIAIQAFCRKAPVRL